jgi:hypothetical protein
MPLLCQKTTRETLFFQKSNIFMADFSLSTSSGWNFDLQGGICFFIRPKKFAKILNVDVRENESIGEYPMIKCNINKTTSEKIYHMPYDQMYDRTIIESSKGEFYAITIDEATAAGFRRAMRHQFVN